MINLKNYKKSNLSLYLLIKFLTEVACYVKINTFVASIAQTALKRFKTFMYLKSESEL